MRRTALTLLTLLTIGASGACGQAIPVLQSRFTGGEISPLASARIDAERYYQSASVLENLVAIPQGPVVRRPGTRFVAATDANQVGRLIPFRYSSDDSYVLEFTDSAMRVFRDHGLVTNDDDSIYELATPFDANELASLQVWQSADTCFLVDGTDWPQKLVRVDHNDWTIADAAIEDGPFLTENLTATTIAADAVSGEDVGLVASEALWQSGHVGSVWRLRDLVSTQTTSGTLTAADQYSDSLACQAGGSFQWKLLGAFVGTVALQMSSDDGASWSPYTIVSSTSVITTTDGEVFSNDTGGDVLLRVYCTEYTSGVCPYSLWVHAYMHTGVVRITSITDPCNAVCDVVRALASTDATVRWSEGAWSGVRGYPRAIASYGDRLVLASTTHQPVTIWFSATGEYESFDSAAGDAADSFGYTLARSEQDPILWLTGQRSRGLISGTSGAVFEIEPFDSASGIRPDNPPTVSNTLAVPCASLPPILADNILLVAQRGGRKIREVLYSYDADALVAPDLTLFAEHVTLPSLESGASGGVVQMAWTNQPYTLLWCVRADGELLSLTYDRNYQIASWSRHTIGGSGVVESLCSIPGAEEDELWLIVRRTVGAQTVRYVEYMAPWNFGGSTEDAYYVDGGLSYDGAPATTFSGLGHMTGQTAAILADGGTIADQTVTAGAVTLDHEASVVHVGWAYTSTLTTVRYDVAGEAGVSWHRPKAIGKVVVDFFETLGATVGPNAGTQIAPDWQSAGGGLLYVGVPQLFTGDREISLPKSFSTSAASVTIVQAHPLPMTVRALVALVEIR